MLKKIVLSSMIASSLFASHQFEINLSDEDVEAGLRLDLSKMNSIDADTYFGMKLLNGHEENSETIFKTDPLLEASFLIMRPVNNMSGLKVGLGIKGEFTDIDGDDFVAVPLGIEVEYKLPLNSPVAVYAGGVFYYAPGPLCFSDADRYIETRASIDFEVIRNGRITVGYRDVETDVKTRDVTYNETLCAGFKLRF